ncbi:MAG TPA: redoxin domain-containing protein [Flavitalea sp.]|nr:redoxin domain-containing protein [Flavitalea sp.]
MKNWFLSFLALMLFSISYTQSGNPPYKESKKLPDFEIQTAGNGVFKTAQIKKNAPVIIMFFSPGCDHCINQFESMKKRLGDFRKYQIIMPTYQPIEELAEFDKKYQLNKHPNIITGRDVNYFFPPYYEISNFPFLAFYDKNGKLLGVHEGNLSVDNILKNFK